MRNLYISLEHVELSNYDEILVFLYECDEHFPFMLIFYHLIVFNLIEVERAPTVFFKNILLLEKDSVPWYYNSLFT